MRPSRAHRSRFLAPRRKSLLLAALVLSALAPPAAAQQGPPARWMGMLQEAEGHLKAGRFAAAGEEMDQLVPELVERLLPGEDSNAFLALALFLRAAAEAGQGEDEAAVWHWQVAQGLDPQMRRQGLPDYGAATALLAANGGRSADEIPAGQPALPEAWDPARYLPPLPIRAPAPPVPSREWRGDRVRLQVVVGPDGRVTAPVLQDVAEAAPGKIYRQLEALREWRFRPASYDGEAVAVPLSVVDLNLPFSPLLSWVRDGDLRPIHDRLLEADWETAEKWAAARVEDFLSEEFLPVGLSGALTFRALAEAGLGRRRDALVSLRIQESLEKSPLPQLPAYGEAGRWLWRHRARCVSRLRWQDGSAASGSEGGGCSAVDPLADAAVTPPRPVDTPPLADVPDLGDERLILRLLVDAEGRVAEARMLAGSELRVAPAALRAVMDWRFAPARRDGEALAALYDTSLPLAAVARGVEVASDRVDRWRRRLAEIEARLEDGDGAGALPAAVALQEELQRDLQRGGSDLLGRALAARALAEAELAVADGNADGAGKDDPAAAAAWHWQMAQNLAPELRYRDLGRHGAAGVLLSAHTLEADSTNEPWYARASHDEPAVLRIVDPELDPGADSADPGASLAEAEVSVDADGRPRAPLLRAGLGPARLSAALEALRHWRFAAPTAEGRRRVVVLRTAAGRPPGRLLNPDLRALVRASARHLDDDPVGAACLWHAAQGVEPRLGEVDLGRLASSPRHEELLRRNLVTSMPRWRWPPPSHIGRPLRVAGEVEAPRKMHAPQPQYTLSARSAGVQGTVILQSVIGTDGRVHRVTVLRGLPQGLSEIAAATVCTWRFEPATLDGEPVEVYYNLTVNFSLSPL